MKELKINPLQARVKGNLLANWEDVLSKTTFEDYHVSREDIANITWNNNSLKAIRLNAVAEKVTLAIAVEDASIYPNGEVTTLTITTKYRKNNTLVALPNHTVYLYDEDVLIATMVTNENGTATYEYGSYVQGTHTITAKTPHMNGFEAATTKVNINIIYNVELYLEPRTLYAGYGEIHQITATLLDSKNVPVPDKPITFYEGVRTLATVNTDENGVAVCSYMESENNGVQTTIIADTVPTQLNDGETNVITGHISTANGELPSGEYMRLYCSKSTYAYVLASARIQNDGTFTFNYTPVANARGNYKYYLVYQGKLNYDTVTMVQTAGWFDLNQWTGTGDGGARYIDGQGLLVCEQQYSFLNYYGEGATRLNGDYWRFTIDIEPNIIDGNRSVFQVGDYNSTEGNTVIRYRMMGWYVVAWENGSEIINEAIPAFTNSTQTRNKVTFERTNSTLKIKYKSVDGENVVLTRSFNQSVPEDSRLMIYNSSCTSKVHMIDIERNNPLRLKESVNGFDLSEWGGTGLTNRTINANGILLLTNEYNYLDRYANDEHYINGYKWRIIIEIELSGSDSANLQQIYDQNFFEGNTAIRRENNVWKFLAWDENRVNVANQIIDDVVNEQHPKNKIIFTRDGNSLLIQYRTLETNELITLRRTFTQNVSMDSRLVIMASVNASWKLYNLSIEQYTNQNNYSPFEPTFTEIGRIPLYIDGTAVDDSDIDIN